MKHYICNVYWLSHKVNIGAFNEPAEIGDYVQRPWRVPRNEFR